MKYRQTERLLVQIETELKQLHLWSATTPSAKALASELPFCYDTLPFEQWLQFVFMPRMQALIEGQRPLPVNISLCPMAEEAFKKFGERAFALINRIAELDELLSAKRQQTIPRI